MSLLVVASALYAVLSFRAANGGAVGVLGSGVTLTNLTGNVFEANTADNNLSSATDDGDGGMGELAVHHVPCSSRVCIMCRSRVHLLQTMCMSATLKPWF